MKLNRVTKILLIASSLWYFGEGLFGPLFAVFAEKVGGDLLDITWAWSAYLIATGVFYVIVGKVFNNSIYKKHLMVVGYGLNTLLTFCYLFIENKEQLFILQIGLGIAEAISTPIWDTLFSTHLEDNESTFHWSLANGHTHFVSGIAIAIGGLIANYVSFNALFITMGTIQAFATIIQAMLLKREQSKTEA
jgi:MFS family permease